MKLPPKIEKWLDVLGAGLALIVDLAMNLICFTTLAPDLLTAVGFAMIGVMIVLFVFRSWSKGQRFAWLIFVSVVFFFDYSYALEATRAQTVAVEQIVDLNTAYNTDPELIRLSTSLANTSSDLRDLQAQYKLANKRETLNEIDEQIKEKRSDERYYEKLYQDRRALVESTARDKAKPKLTSKAIFSAIPNCYKDGMYTQLIVYGLIFFGLQLIVAISIDPLNKSKKSRISAILDAFLANITGKANQAAEAPSKSAGESKSTAERFLVTKKRLAKDPSKPAQIDPVPVASLPAEPLEAQESQKSEETPVVPIRKLPVSQTVPEEALTDMLGMVLTPARDNELKNPDALAYEHKWDVATISKLFAALAETRGPAGRPLLYQKEGKWYLGYTKDLVIATIKRIPKVYEALGNSIIN